MTAAFIRHMRAAGLCVGVHFIQGEVDQNSLLDLISEGVQSITLGVQSMDTGLEADAVYRYGVRRYGDDLEPLCPKENAMGALTNQGNEMRASKKKFPDVWGSVIFLYFLLK